MIQLKEGHRYKLRDGQVITLEQESERSWRGKAYLPEGGGPFTLYWDQDGTFHSEKDNPSYPLHVVEDLGPVDPRGTEGLKTDPVGVLIPDQCATCGATAHLSHQWCKEVNWEQRRWDAAKEILGSALLELGLFLSPEDHQSLSVLALDQADTFIEEYKKREEKKYG